MPKNVLKARLAAGEQVYGAWVGTGATVNAEIMGHIGYDFLVIDHEHGLGELSQAVESLRAAEAGGTPCIVRAPWNDQVWLKRILDAGGNSIMIPSVENAEEALAAIRACRYPPHGTRGYAASVVRGSRYGLETGYAHAAKDETLVILQIESGAAAEQAEKICALDGIDVVFIGVNDLACSLGYMEQLDHPEVRKVVTKLEDVILASGKPMGTVPNAGADWRSLFQRGYKLVVGPHDGAMLRDSARNAWADYQSFKAGR
ncbi:HpcH/HpaI aldolase/citrate lyase family protein [Roseomonas sp. 18066]|uniref:HpcH/HpaI aldolase family protein n=1 Tax=Roseomonas sp. 18066 TaxID=2681412 RepID=UPI00190FB043|nr:aldolase/citrate lyase family protein [Roseomonas sp. 18066]